MFCRLLTITLLFAMSIPASAQNEQSKQDQTDSTTPAKTDDGATDKKSDKEKPAAKVDAQTAQPEIPTYTGIIKLLSQRKIERAQQALEEALADAPDNPQLNSLRIRVASSLYSARKYKESYDALVPLLEYQLDNVDQPQVAAQITSALSIFRIAASRVGKADESFSWQNKMFDKLSEMEDTESNLRTLTSLTISKSQTLVRTENGAVDAEDLLSNQLSRIDSYVKNSEDSQLVAERCRLLKELAVLPNAKPDAMQTLDDALAAMIENAEGSNTAYMQYASIQMSLIGQSYRDAPDAASARVAKAVEILENAPEPDDRMIKMYRDRIGSYQSRIDAALKMKEMIGKPAPEFQVEAWVNQGDLTVDSLKGKVVLVDFWSIWCGPCIATFPHLREWHDEFHEKGFEIVGVTRYYNYVWDEDAERAKRSQDDVPAEEEQEMLVQFMKHHELKHSTIITPKDSTMQKEYGVTGIPHVALLDREGNVQMVKVGAGPTNAQALHEKIKELLGEE